MILLEQKFFSELLKKRRENFVPKGSSQSENNYESDEEIKEI